MSSRSVNKAILIGNLTRDPELRYTPQGTAVCTFSLATNRSWMTESNEKREEVEFHRVVAWNKLAELCAQLLFKGRKVYVEGRLSTRSWTAQDGTQRQTTEVVAEEMIILDNKVQEGAEAHPGYESPINVSADPSMTTAPGVTASPVVPTVAPVMPTIGGGDDIASLSIDDIPDDLGVSEPIVAPVGESVIEPIKEKPVTIKKTKSEIPTDVITETPSVDPKVSSDIPF